MMRSPTRDETILPKAAPMMTPTARSITLPRITNALKSLTRPMIQLLQGKKKTAKRGIERRTLRGTTPAASDSYRAALRLAGHGLPDESDHGQQHGAADAASHDVGQQGADVNARRISIRHHQAQHLQDGSADPAAQDSDNRIAYGSQAFVFHRGPGNVAADRPAHET